jgi:hypothetical protein
MRHYLPISPPPNVTNPAIMARMATIPRIHSQRGIKSPLAADGEPV